MKCIICQWIETAHLHPRDAEFRRAGWCECKTKDPTKETMTTKPMTTKPLFILISDGGDGSYYPKFTFNTKLIEKLQQAYDEDKMDYETGIGVDGDGFHYETLNVPADCTAESLGISLLNDNYADSFFED